MANERIELTPTEQLEALCNARDYYTTRAEEIHNQALTSLAVCESDTLEEERARRFAAAYDRSAKNQRAMIEHRRS